MGNYISCALATAAAGRSRSATVVLPGGGVRRLDGPANAAELMLDVPGHFLVDSRSMNVGRRFVPLAADEGLEMGRVYVMFPMGRINAVVSAADVAGSAAAAAANRKGWRASAAMARVLPDSSSSSSSPQRAQEMAAGSGKLTGLEKMDDASAEVGMFKYRLSVSRSRRPALETIAEEGGRSGVWVFRKSFASPPRVF